jgi:hypothetical protein
MSSVTRCALQITLVAPVLILMDIIQWVTATFTRTVVYVITGQWRDNATRIGKRYLTSRTVLTGSLAFGILAIVIISLLTIVHRASLLTVRATLQRLPLSYQVLAKT